MKESPIVRRNRVKHTLSIEERLLGAARRAREAAGKLPPGKDREMLFRSARDKEAAAELNRWISSPGLRPPE